MEPLVSPSIDNAAYPLSRSDSVGPNLAPLLRRNGKVAMGITSAIEIEGYPDPAASIDFEVHMYLGDVSNNRCPELATYEFRWDAETGKCTTDADEYESQDNMEMFVVEELPWSLKTEAGEAVLDMFTWIREHGDRLIRQKLRLRTVHFFNELYDWRSKDKDPQRNINKIFWWTRLEPGLLRAFAGSQGLLEDATFEDWVGLAVSRLGSPPEDLGVDSLEEEYFEFSEKYYGTHLR
jgi:hypothetical protein